MTETSAISSTSFAHWKGQKSGEPLQLQQHGTCSVSVHVIGLSGKEQKCLAPNSTAQASKPPKQIVDAPQAYESSWILGPYKVVSGTQSSSPRSSKAAGHWKHTLTSGGGKRARTSGMSTF